jgi:hypothetical protein
MNRRRVAPSYRQEKQRTVERLYNGSGLGLATDTISTPQNAFAELFNARDHKTEVRGRQGSFLHSAAKYAILPEDIIEEPGAARKTFSQVLDMDKFSEVANGDTIMIYSYLDTLEEALTLLKQQSLSYMKDLTAYDCFRVIEIQQMQLEYIGNIAAPYNYDFQTDVKSITRVESKEENIITLTDWPQLDDSVIGSYFNWGYNDTYYPRGQRDYILERSGTEGTQYLTVQETEDTPIVEHFGSTIQPIIYASVYSQERSVVVIHSGERLYYSEVPISGWKEIPGIYESALYGDWRGTPFAGVGILSEVKNDILLSNANGHFRIIFDKNGAHYYKANSQAPTEKTIAQPVKIWGFKDSKIDLDKGILYEIVGFPGYSTYDAVTNPRGGDDYYSDGQIL